MNPTKVLTVTTIVVAAAAGLALSGVRGSSGADESFRLPSGGTSESVPSDMSTDTVNTAPTSEVASVSGTTVPNAEPTVSEPTVTVGPSETTPASVRDRSAVAVVVANGGAGPGAATVTTAELEALGYSDVRPTDALEPVTAVVVHYADGLAAEAARLATDLGWPASSIAPLSELPPLDTTGPYELVAVLVN